MFSESSTWHCPDWCQFPTTTQIRICVNLAQCAIYFDKNIGEKQFKTNFSLKSLVVLLCSIGPGAVSGSRKGSWALVCQGTMGFATLVRGCSSGPGAVSGSRRGLGVRIRGQAPLVLGFSYI